MELNEQQKKVVETTASKVVVVASAAAGKTAILVERIKHLLAEGEDPKGIVLITFTNAAAGELSDRLGRPKGMFIGTIHAYANYLLLIDGKDTSQILTEEKFDKLFAKIEHHPECIRPVNHLLLDEAQDSNEIQFHFLLDMVKPKNYMLVGDHRQSIYRWNGAYPDYLLNLMDEPGVITYQLNYNYRNGSCILDYAKSIIRQAGLEYNDHSVAKSDRLGKVLTVAYSPQAIARTIKEKGNYGSWFILGRTNSQVDEMIYHLKALGIPCDSFKRSHLSNDELYKTMKSDTVKVLTIHTAKGLEAENVIVIGARMYNVEEVCISYVAATRAKNLLVWTTTPQKKRKRDNGMINWER